MDKLHDSIIYRGDIEITIKNENGSRDIKRTHNAGTADLWSFLCRCLCKDYVPANAPTRIDICDASGISCLYSKLTTSSRYSSDENGEFAIISCALTASNVKSSLSDGPYKLKMYDGNSNVIANAEVAQSKLPIGGLGSRSIIIDWKMSFKNSEDKNNEGEV